MEIILVVLGVIGVIIAIDWLAAEAMYEIAVMKGHPQRKYFCTDVRNAGAAVFL